MRRGGKGLTAAGSRPRYRREDARNLRGKPSVLIDVLLWVLTVACASTTLWFSFGAPPPGANLFSWADKAGHAIAYFATTLSFLFAGVWRPGRGTGPFARWGWWFPVLGIALAGAIEIAQGMTSNRSSELLDVLAAAIGISAATVLHSIVRAWVTSRSARAHQRK